MIKYSELSYRQSILFGYILAVYSQLVEKSHDVATKSLKPTHCITENRFNLTAVIHARNARKMLVNDGAWWYDARSANKQSINLIKSTHSLFKGACRFKA